MRTRYWIAVAALGALSGTGGAQPDISGTWAGELEVAPDTQLEVHFVLTRAGSGSYAAVVTSPDPGGVKDVAASAVRFEGGRLSLTVDALNGSYEGTLTEGTLTGEWRQQGTSLPLELVPYDVSVLALDLSAEEMAELGGAWRGTLTTPGGDVELTIRLETTADGEAAGYLEAPALGISDLHASAVTYTDDRRLAISFQSTSAAFAGEVSGDEARGEWTAANGAVTPLTLTRQALER